MNTETKTIQQLAIDTVRILAADAVQKANTSWTWTSAPLRPMSIS